MALNTNVGPIC